MRYIRNVPPVFLIPLAKSRTAINCVVLSIGVIFSYVFVWDDGCPRGDHAF